MIAKNIFQPRCKHLGDQFKLFQIKCAAGSGNEGTTFITMIYPLIYLWLEGGKERDYEIKYDPNFMMTLLW